MTRSRIDPYEERENFELRRIIFNLESEVARLSGLQQIHESDLQNQAYRLGDIHNLELKNKELELRLEMAERERILVLQKQALSEKINNMLLNRESNALLPPTSLQSKDDLLLDALPAATEAEIVDNMDEESHNKGKDADE